MFIHKCSRNFDYTRMYLKDSNFLFNILSPIVPHEDIKFRRIPEYHKLLTKQKGKNPKQVLSSMTKKTLFHGTRSDAEKKISGLSFYSKYLCK